MKVVISTKKWVSLSIFIAVLIIFLSPVQVIEISGNRTVLIPVSDHRKFEISFIHSVELCRWIEIYEVREGKIHLIKTLTRSAGWGLPSTGNFSFEVINGEEWMVYYLDREFDDIPISTDPVNDYTLTVGDTVLKLASLGKRIDIKIVAIPSIQYWGWKADQYWWRGDH